jgi:hypothetical protein
MVTLTTGARVLTPLGLGTVAYVRMAPPEYTAPAAVSVVLDVKADRPGYTGTLFPATAVLQDGRRKGASPCTGA